MSSSVKKALAGALAAALLLLPLSGCGGKKAQAAPELLEPKGVTLDTAAVRRGTIQTITAYEGLVLPAVRELSFAVSGVMTGVEVCAGSRVKEGQELARLDVGPYEAALESMESYLAYADENEAIIEREQEIQIEYADSSIVNGCYIEGINYLYEFSAGKYSGWMFSVDGEVPNYAANQVKLQGGERISWYYVVDYREG